MVTDLDLAWVTLVPLVSLVSLVPLVSLVSDFLGAFKRAVHYDVFINVFMYLDTLKKKKKKKKKFFFIQAGSSSSSTECRKLL